MKTILTLFLDSLFVSLLVATTTVGQGRFSIAPTLSPTYLHLNWVSRFENTDVAIGSQSMTGISAGLTAFYAFTPKWSVSAGLLYNRSGGDSHYNNLTYISTQASRYENWQLPLLVNYSLFNRRLSPYFSTGLLANHTFRTTNPTTMVSSYHTIDDGLTFTFSLYGMVGMGIRYEVSPKLALIIQPTAAYRLNAPSNGSTLSYTRWREYLYGLQTQLKFTF